MGKERYFEKIFKSETGVVVGVQYGAGELVCDGAPMVALEEKTADFKTEKHVPVITPCGSGIKVVVGSTPHPMTEEHHIVWIEVVDGAYVYRKYLAIGEPAEAEFPIAYSEDLAAREYCNLHGLWRKS